MVNMWLKDGEYQESFFMHYCLHCYIWDYEDTGLRVETMQEDE